jgi:hypothetical protein
MNSQSASNNIHLLAILVKILPWPEDQSSNVS